ncbi:DODA-type extradiol aromatic ring-opening family dioxygenase [Sporobolomyces koalae]|uniref:DODA-type extradiol aromatic ring-opening family dioxygenase n=1 Tax=Sporobolomyces koalae TaxID=500713 RepID=UPI00316D5F12
MHPALQPVNLSLLDVTRVKALRSGSLDHDNVQASPHLAYLRAAAVAGLAGLISLVLINLSSSRPISLLDSTDQQYMQRALARLSALLPYTTTTHVTSNCPKSTNMSASSTTPPSQVLATREEWRRELQALPTLEENGNKIPSVFLAHGQPMLLMPPHLAKNSPMLATLGEIQGPDGLLSQFLQDLGPVLLQKYSPKAIVVFSAHFESDGGGIVTDYDENPLLYDYFGFPKEMYDIKFRSSGDSDLAQHVVELLHKAGISRSRLTTRKQARGRDGRGHEGPGLDHGVFVPFKLMFGDQAPIPIVQVSIPSDLSPLAQRSIGQALEPLRAEGILIVSGGLTIHTFQDFSAFSPTTAKPIFHSFEASIISAVSEPDYHERKSKMDSLVKSKGFRESHPREEHFVPIYIAAGAANDSEKNDGKKSKLLSGLWGAKTVIFGI